MNVGIVKTPVQRTVQAEVGDQVFPTASESADAGRTGGHRLWRRAARECEAMAEHAFGVGLSIPADVAILIDQVLVNFGRDPGQAAKTRNTLQYNEDAPTRPGIPTTSAVAMLSKAHAALAIIIKPATPESVLLLIEERRNHSVWYAFGPLPIVRHMLGLAGLSLVILLVVSLSPEINTENLSRTGLQLQGIPLLMVEIFLLSAASLGSCFQNLQQINSYISSGTYDPKFQSTYWTRWVMGVISGIVLSQLVYDLIVAPANTHSATSTIPESIGQPALALLGGYSVDIVHGILSNVINAIGRFFRDPGGTPGERRTVDVAEEAAARERLTIASEVAELRGTVAADPNSEEILKRVDDLLSRRAPRAG